MNTERELFEKGKRTGYHQALYSARETELLLHCGVSYAGSYIFILICVSNKNIANIVLSIVHRVYLGDFPPSPFFSDFLAQLCLRPYSFPDSFTNIYYYRYITKCVMPDCITQRVCGCARIWVYRVFRSLRGKKRRSTRGRNGWSINEFTGWNNILPGGGVARIAYRGVANALAYLETIIFFLSLIPRVIPLHPPPPW